MGKAALEARLSDAHYGSSAEFERSSKRMFRAMVPPTPPLRILDVGCGTGLNAAFLAASGHTVIGVDLSQVAIDKFREKGFEGFVCDLESQNLPDFEASFDLVFASEIIEHIADTAMFLDRLARLLKPNGQLLLSTPNSAFWAYRLLGLMGYTASEYQHPGHVRFFSKRSLQRAIKASGFEITAVSGRHMPLLLGSLADPLAPLLRVFGMQREDRFATGGHFWQLSRFAPKASGFWSDTIFVAARRLAD